MVSPSSFRRFMLTHLCLRSTAPFPRKFPRYELRRHGSSPITTSPQLLPSTPRPSSVSYDGAEIFLRVCSGVQLQ